MSQYPSEGFIFFTLLNFKVKGGKLPFFSMFMKTNEHQLQVACVNYFRIKYPNYLIFSIPNAGKRSVRAGVYYKAEGLVAGVPDLFVPEPCGYFAGLFIEMKTESKSSKPTPAQEAMMQKLRARGYSVHICRSLEEFISACENYFASGFKN